MKTFKNIMEVINVTFGNLFFGTSMAELFFEKDYRTASYMMFIVAILFVVGYYAEKWIE